MEGSWGRMRLCAAVKFSNMENEQARLLLSLKVSGSQSGLVPGSTLAHALKSESSRRLASRTSEESLTFCLSCGTWGFDEHTRHGANTWLFHSRKRASSALRMASLPVLSAPAVGSWLSSCANPSDWN